MAKRNDNPRVGKSGFNSRFVNISLSAENERHLRDLIEAGKFSLELALECVGEGFKFSVNYDSNNNTYVASLTSYPQQDRTSCVILTGRGSTALNAIFSLLYKHHVLSEGLWASGNEEKSISSDFG